MDINSGKLAIRMKYHQILDERPNGYKWVTMSPNKIVYVHNTLTCDRPIPIHTGRLPLDKAALYLSDVNNHFKLANYKVRFVGTTNDVFKHALLGLKPYILRLDIDDSSPPVLDKKLKIYYDFLAKWYGWCLDNCESEFILNQFGFGFKSTDDCILFKITFGEKLTPSW